MLVCISVQQLVKYKGEQRGIYMVRNRYRADVLLVHSIIM